MQEEGIVLFLILFYFLPITYFLETLKGLIGQTY